MDKTSFTAAVERYQDTVYRVALHVLASPQDADDAAQEVFLRLYTAKKPFQSEEHLRRWLLRVTVNYCRDVLRSPWRKRRASLEEVPPQPIFQQLEEEALYQAVMALPEIYRIVPVLYYYEELSAREIGELLELETPAVTTRLSRARAKLKEQLGEVWQDDEPGILSKDLLPGPQPFHHPLGGLCPEGAAQKTAAPPAVAAGRCCGSAGRPVCRRGGR